MNEAPLHLDSNLRQLNAISPELVERVSIPVQTEHVRFDGVGNAEIRLNERWEPLSLSETACDSLLDGEPVPRLLLCGVGTGEMLENALQQNRADTIIAWERDPYLLRLTLARVNLQQAIRTGRLQLALGADLLDFMGSCDKVVAHPTLAFSYKRELKLAKTPPKDEPWVLLCHGGLFVDDLGDALEREGFQCFPWPIDLLPESELRSYVGTVRPKLVAAINYRNGLAEACKTFNLPLLCWEIDPTIDRVRPCEKPQPHANIFTWRKAHQTAYQNAGFPNTYFTPLASSTHRRYPRSLADNEKEHYGARVCFVGASCTSQLPTFRQLLLADLVPFLEQTQPGIQAEDVLLRVLDQQRTDFSRFQIPELTAAWLPGFADFIRRRGQSYDPDIVIGEIAAAEKRMTYLANLAKFGLQVWGDDGWKTLEKYGVNYRGRAGHLVELTTIYNAADIHVDIGRIYQSDIVTMRVFDVLACGGFLLAEYSDGLGDLFDLDQELVCYRDLDELIDKVTFYQDNPTIARRIADRGRARVERDHTIERRVREMLSKTLAPASRERVILVG